MKRQAAGVWIALSIAACSLTKPSRDEITGGGHAGTPSDGSAATSGSGGSSAIGGGGGSGGGGTGGTVAGGGSGGSGGTAGSAGVDGSAGAAEGGTGGVAEAATVLFEDPFDVQKVEWKFGGDGNWSLDNGFANQNDSIATHPIRWVSTLATASDYRLNARAKRLDTNSGALQFIFRLNDANPNEFYYVSWHPALGAISFGKYFGAFDTVDISNSTVTLPAGYDPNQIFTLHLEVKGSKFHFWVDEVTGADAIAYDTSYATGAPGLKTYQLASAYDWFSVEAL